MAMEIKLPAAQEPEHLLYNALVDCGRAQYEDLIANHPVDEILGLSEAGGGIFEAFFVASATHHRGQHSDVALTVAEICATIGNDRVAVAAKGSENGRGVGFVMGLKSTANRVAEVYCDRNIPPSQRHGAIRDLLERMGSERRLGISTVSFWQALNS